MIQDSADFWTEKTSVLFTSFWGWSPESWGTIGWTGEEGRSRRAALLQELTNPFIAVVYVTKAIGDEHLRGKIAGFYLVSHEVGHRDEFTHPSHHDLEPQKWEHSLRAVRAFSYVPELTILAADFDPTLRNRSLAVSRWCETITDPEKIALLRAIPWVETAVYRSPQTELFETATNDPLRGFNRAGPANRSGYAVSSSAQDLKRELYALRFNGPVDAFLGRPAQGKQIYKIGLSASPALRMQSLQGALPDGAFRWCIHRQSGQGQPKGLFSFEAAVTGEYAMKNSLAKSAEWLGGEFYLASEEDLSTAWKLGIEAATSYTQN